MNSSADIKAFCGRHGGAVCTSSNAQAALEWAYAQKGPDTKVLFLPDQHLGRNTAVREMGFALEDCVVWNPLLPGGGLSPEQLRDARIILWKGHCSVHGRFSEQVVDELRATVPGVTDPGAPRVPLRGRHQGRPRGLDRVHHQDRRGRAGRFDVGDRHRAQPREAAGRRPPEQNIMFLDRTVCYCSTMNRIDLPHLVWALESLVEGQLVNVIEVDPDTEHWAKVALQRMLDLPGKSHRD